MNQKTEQPFPIDILERKPAFRGHLRVDELILRHGRFGGGMTDVFSREIVSRADAVVVVPYDPIADKVVLIEQFRACALMNDDRAWMIEWVAGVIDEGESPEAVCVRELQEESGLSPTGPLLPVTGVYATQGFCSERFFVYCAPVDSSKAAGLHGLADEHEDIRVFTLPFAEAYALWEAGRMGNGAGTIGILWLALHRERLRKRWEMPRGLPQPAHGL